MMLSNFNKYEYGHNEGGSNEDTDSATDGMTNFEALNFVQTMFPAMFNMLNCLLITVLQEDARIKKLQVVSVFVI